MTRPAEESNRASPLSRTRALALRFAGALMLVVIGLGIAIFAGGTTLWLLIVALDGFRPDLGVPRWLAAGLVLAVPVAAAMSAVCGFARSAHWIAAGVWTIGAGSLALACAYTRIPYGVVVDFTLVCLGGSLPWLVLLRRSAHELRVACGLVAMGLVAGGLVSATRNRPPDVWELSDAERVEVAVEDALRAGFLQRFEGAHDSARRLEASLGPGSDGHPVTLMRVETDEELEEARRAFEAARERAVRAAVERGTLHALLARLPRRPVRVDPARTWRFEARGARDR